ncbi:MAG: glycerol-3-phosphate dehydrogenase subunit GlpB [Desulfohalobiaceae bacterium]|nr:glycerol-3-phosphate dehydrogenase subunit GlpB [Desulfohalobiaceae bacterium]
MITLQTDLTIIGSGIAGLSAALFAVQKGLGTVLIGDGGASEFASGLLDVLGAFSGESITQWDDPWAGIAALPQRFPGHPYNCLQAGEIEQALAEVVRALSGAGLAYAGDHQKKNVRIMTGPGRYKLTYRVPETMWPGVEAFEDKSPCLVVDFHGLKDFSGPWLRSSLAEVWPGLRTERIRFPETQGKPELLAVRLAQSLESEQVREKLAGAVAPLIRGDKFLAFPALLGMYSSGRIRAELEERLGVSVFEIPIMPPSVPGLRLLETLGGILNGYSCFRRESGKRVCRARQEASKEFVLNLDDGGRICKVISRRVILATGRFLGRGLQAEPGCIREAVFDLPVVHPGEDGVWHREDLFDQRGHPANRAGLEVDPTFRPLDRQGNVLYENLYAVGSILAHSDWMRMKCGAGVAIASAFKAVGSCL